MKSLVFLASLITLTASICYGASCPATLSGSAWIGATATAYYKDPSYYTVTCQYKANPAYPLPPTKIYAKTALNNSNNAWGKLPPHPVGLGVKCHSTYDQCKFTIASTGR